MLAAGRHRHRPDGRCAKAGLVSPRRPCRCRRTDLLRLAPRRSAASRSSMRHEHNLKHLDDVDRREPAHRGHRCVRLGQIDARLRHRLRRRAAALPHGVDAYARQFVQPPPLARVGRILGLSPTVAIEQRTSRGGYKSTVGMLTEIAPFLRLLYARLGTPYCPECGVPLEPLAATSLAQRLAMLPSPLSYVLARAPPQRDLQGTRRLGGTTRRGDAARRRREVPPTPEHTRSGVAQP